MANTIQSYRALNSKREKKLHTAPISVPEPSMSTCSKTPQKSVLVHQKGMPICCLHAPLLPWRERKGVMGQGWQERGDGTAAAERNTDRERGGQEWKERREGTGQQQQLRHRGSDRVAGRRNSWPQRGEWKEWNKTAEQHMLHQWQLVFVVFVEEV